MPARGRGLVTKASRSRARSNPPDEEEELVLPIQRLRDKLRESQPFYVEEDVVVIPFPSAESGNTSPVFNSTTAAHLTDVPPFSLDDVASPPCSPTKGPPTNARLNHPSAAATATINLDVPLSPTLFLTAVNLLDTKAIARSRRAAMEALKLIGQGYSLIWQDNDFIVDAAKHPPTPTVSALMEDSGTGRRSSSPAMGGVRAAMRGPHEPSTATATNKSVSPVPTHRPPPHLVKMLDECMQSLLVYANKSSTLSQFITAHQPTLHLFCFVGSAARAIDEGGEWGDDTELLTDRHRPTSSSFDAADTITLPQRDVELELRELNHLWETCGLAGTRLIDHMRECYLIEFLLDAALPPAVCSARYDGITAALLEKKKRLIAELASSRSPLANMVSTLPLRSLMSLLNMSAAADPKQRAKLLDKLAAEGLLDTLLRHIQTAMAEWMRWSSSVSSPASPSPPPGAASKHIPSPPARRGSQGAKRPRNGVDRDHAGSAGGDDDEASRSPTLSPGKRRSARSPPATTRVKGTHWSERAVPSTTSSPNEPPSAANAASLDGGCDKPHLQYLPLTPPVLLANAETPALTSSTSGRGRKRRLSREAEEGTPCVRPEAPIVRLGFCVEILLLLTSPNLRHPQEADEMARNLKTAASAVVRATVWAENTTALEGLVAHLLWIIAASSVAFEEEVSLQLFDIPTSLLASLQEQAMDCVLQLAMHNSALYSVVVHTLERLLSDRLVLSVEGSQPSGPRASQDGRRSVSPARRAVGRRSGSSAAKATKAATREGSVKPSLSSSTTVPSGELRTVHVHLTGAGGLLPLLVSLLCRAEEAQKHAESIRQWFAWLTAHLVPSAFEYPTLTNGRRSGLAWGTTIASRHGRGNRRSPTPSPPPRGQTAPMLSRDLRRDEVASLLPYFRFGTRLVLETTWRDGAEAFLARLAILAYHVVLGRRNNLSFGQASACYDVVAPLLESVTGLLPGQAVAVDGQGSNPHPSETTPGHGESDDWFRENFVLVPTPSKTPSEARTGPQRTPPSGTRQPRRKRSTSPQRSTQRAPRDSMQTFIPSPSRSPIFYEAYSPSSDESPTLRKRSPPATPSMSTPGKKRGRSPASAAADAQTPDPAQEPSSPPPATAASPLATTRSSWRDRLSLRMFLSSLSLTGASSTPHRGSGEE